MGHAVRRGKDTTYKNLETMRNARAWSRQCRQSLKSCANGSNFVALRFGDYGTKEMLGEVSLKI